MDVSLPVNPTMMTTLLGYQYDTMPHYFLYGGLVFTPVSFDYLRAVGGNTSDPAQRQMVPKEPRPSARPRPWQSAA